MYKIMAISFLVIAILRLEFVLRFEFSLNVYEKVCSVTLNLLFLRIFEARITHEASESVSGILHLQVGKKHSRISFFNDEGEKKVWNALPLAAIRDILQELRISELAVDAKVGDKDALTATMLMGSTKIIYCSFLSYLRSKRELVSYENFVPYYNEHIYMVDVSGILRISIADIIYILGIIIEKKRYHKKNLITITQKEMN